MAEPLRNAVEVRLRSRNADRRPEKRNNGQVVLVDLCQLRRGERERHPQLLSRCSRVEPRRHDTHNGDRRVVESDDPIDYARIAREATAPQTVAQHSDIVLPDAILIIAKHAAHDRRDPKDPEKPAGHAPATDTLRCPDIRQVDRAELLGTHRAERPALRLPISKVSD